MYDWLVCSCQGWIWWNMHPHLCKQVMEIQILQEKGGNSDPWSKSCRNHLIPSRDAPSQWLLPYIQLALEVGLIWYLHVIFGFVHQMLGFKSRFDFIHSCFSVFKYFHPNWYAEMVHSRAGWQKATAMSNLSLIIPSVILRITIHICLSFSLLLPSLIILVHSHCDHFNQNQQWL